MAVRAILFIRWRLVFLASKLPPVEKKKKKTDREGQKCQVDLVDHKWLNSLPFQMHSGILGHMVSAHGSVIVCVWEELKASFFMWEATSYCNLTKVSSEGET